MFPFSSLLGSFPKSSDDDSEDEDAKNSNNGAKQLWQGTVKRRGFRKFLFEVCKSGSAARRYLDQHKVSHYWDMLDSGAAQ